MRIALINGSPKTNKSSSGILLTDLKKCILDHVSVKTELKEICLRESTVSTKVLEEMKDAEVWVIACPLYVDGIPAHFLSCLIQLQECGWQNHKTYVYGIVNCGFYEGIQAEYALDIMRNWCIKTGLNWCGGLGVGGGGGLGKMPAASNGHGPKAPIEKALCAMTDKIFQREVQENIYVSVAFPRFLYKMAAQMGWRQMIKANGGKIRDLSKRPE